MVKDSRELAKFAFDIEAPKDGEKVYRVKMEITTENETHTFWVAASWIKDIYTKMLHIEKQGYRPTENS